MCYFLVLRRDFLNPVPVSRGRAINQGPGVEDAPLIKKASLTPSQ
jgi:hypothetical protein